jgi:RHS repeat-associated protein
MRRFFVLSFFVFMSYRTDFLINKGFTGHEHMTEFGLINMNGRVYDPSLGMFLSPDPLIQEPGNPLNYNPYSYVWNNPLRYTDPSGYAGRDEMEKMSDDARYADYAALASIGGGSGRASIFPKMGTMNSPHSFLEYDIALANSYDREFGGAFFTDGLRRRVSNSFYKRGKAKELYRNFLYQDGNLRGVTIYYGYGIDSGVSTQSTDIYLTFNGTNLTLMDNGNAVFSARAVSGRPLDDGSFDYSTEQQKKSFEGPIPAGNYSINPQKIQRWLDQSLMQKAASIFGKGTWPGGTYSWGAARVWIESGGDETRGNFSIHGGFIPGSAGCIDLVNGDRNFFNALQNYNYLNNIPLIVKY